MGIFSWLFGKPKTRIPPRLARFSMKVVGESNYQANLEAICGKRTEMGENRVVTAMLILEDSNPHDPNAVRVDIQGKTVGYLSRAAAKKYRKRFPGQNGAQCAANIRGGWKRKGTGDDTGFYGVWLDLSAN
jgi:hypothetical protein